MNKIFAQVDYAVYRKTYSGWNIPQRTINNHELVFITKGKGKIIYDKRTVEVSENDVVYFYPGIKHSLCVDKEPFMEFYGVHFSFEENKNKLNLPDIFNIKGNVKIPELLSELLKTWNSKEYMFEWRQDLLISEIIYTIYKLMYVKEEISAANDVRITKVIDYIHKNPFEHHTMSSLCSVSKLKKSCLSENFKKMTGLSPINYCKKLKLEYSKSMLMESDLTVREISSKCGFNDEFYYSRMFRKQFGLSPSEYRKRQ